MARIIVITSGKGGVGKTTVTANLGYRLAAMGRRVCLVDADFGLNNLDEAAGVENLVVYDVVDCIEGRCRLKQALVESPLKKNLFVLPSAHSFARSQVDANSFNELIGGLSSSFDYVLIDCPAGVGGGFHKAVTSSDEAIIVTALHLSALRDADKVLGIVKSYSLKKVSLVVNMVRGDLVADKSIISPEKTEDVLKTELIGVIPSEDCIFLNGAARLPADSGAYKAFKMLAANVDKNKNKIYNYSADYVGFLGSIRRGLKRTL